jgi:23S rRNA (guanosine2251-2'-O)-methyltransferase
MLVILHNLRSAENVGSIFRTADAAGAIEVLLVGTTPQPIDRFGRPNPKIAKAALGAEKVLRWKYFKTIAPAITYAQKKNCEVIALEQHPTAKNYRTYKPKKSWALVVGNEVEGIPAAVLKKCDAIIEIPMHGSKESLNVAVATGIALFALADTKAA